VVANRLAVSMRLGLRVAGLTKGPKLHGTMELYRALNV